MARSNRKSPQSVSDFIALLEAVKDKYGDVQVRYVTERYGFTDTSEYYEWDDFVMVNPPHSLVKDENNEDNTYLLFVAE